MFFGNSTQDTRPLFFSSWQKYKQNHLLTPLEQQLVNVMLEHPEYHQMFDQSTSTQQSIEVDNPFLHLGLHLAIRDQVTLNRPPGIATIYQTLNQQYPDAHHIEHLMMEPLARILWEASQHQRLPDDVAYLKACKELIST